MPAKGATGLCEEANKSELLVNDIGALPGNDIGALPVNDIGAHPGNDIGAHPANDIGALGDFVMLPPRKLAGSHSTPMLFSARSLSISPLSSTSLFLMPFILCRYNRSLENSAKK